MFVPLSSLSLDFLEWLKSLCIDVYIIATFGVVIGVYWERDSAPEAVQHEGWTLLVRALAIELLVGALVFAIDGEISHRQQTTIASQQRTIEQLLRPRRLTTEQKARIGAAVAPFRLPFMILTSHDAEAWDLAMEIAATLKANGWDWQPYPGPGIFPMDGRPKAGVTIVDHIEIQGPPERAALVNALVAAIRDPAVIGMADVRPFISPNVKIMTIIAGTKR